MKLKQLRIGIDTPIYIMLAGMMAIQIAIPLQINIIVSLGTWLIIISTAMAFALALMRRNINDNNLFAIIVLAIIVFVSIVVSFIFEYQSIVYALSFLEIPLLMISYSKIRTSNVRKAIYVSFIILSIYYHCLSFSPLSNIYYTDYGARIERFITLGYQNPNETAMHLIICVFILLIMLKGLKNVFAKCLIVLDVFFLIRLIMLTFSRTGIVCLLLFVIFSVLFRKRKVPNYFVKICLLIPIGFIVLTFMLSTRNLDWVFLGESIETGRREIYTVVFEKLNVLSFFFGDYSFGFRNLHNAFLSIFATIGIIGTVVFYVFLYHKTKNIRNHIVPKSSSQVALISLLCIFIYTATESAFLISGGTFAVAFISLYFLSIFDADQNSAEIFSHSN